MIKESLVFSKVIFNKYYGQQLASIIAQCPHISFAFDSPVTNFALIISLFLSAIFCPLTVKIELISSIKSQIGHSF